MCSARQNTCIAVTAHSCHATARRQRDRWRKRERESATEREGEPVCVYSSQPVTLKGKIYYKASVNKCKAQVDCTVLKMSDKLLEKEVFLDSYIF